MRVLYLDTARLGQTSPSALQAQIDFARLTTEAPSSLYFERFLERGDSNGRFLQGRFPGLVNWPGVAGLKKRLCQFAQTPRAHNVLIGSRSGNMLELAAQSMFSVARKLLVTDLTWAPYRTRLGIVARARKREIHYLRLRSGITHDRMSASEVVHRIVNAYESNGCDSIFLPKVDNWGIKLPVGAVLREIQHRSEMRFSVVDAAQALGHVPLEDCWAGSDVVLAGTHKWLRSGLPLSLAFYGRERSRDIVEHYAFRSTDPRSNHDSLLAFTEQLSGGQSMNYAETVNVSPLMSGWGALCDAVSVQNLNLPSSSRNRRSIATVKERSSRDWQVASVDDQLGSHIQLLYSGLRPRTGLGNELRTQFVRRGIVLSAYDSGIIRVSHAHLAGTAAERRDTDVDSWPNHLVTMDGNSIPKASVQSSPRG